MSVLSIATIAMAAGAGVFLLLGAAHVVVTLQSSPAEGPMTPINPDVRAAMSTSGGIGMAPDLDATLWRAWFGFNLSHAVGIMVIAAIVMSQVLTGFETAFDQVWFPVVVFIAPAVYLLLSMKYWFREPTVGIGIGTALLWLGAIVGLVGQ